MRYRVCCFVVVGVVVVVVVAVIVCCFLHALFDLSSAGLIERTSS